MLLFGGEFYVKNRAVRQHAETQTVEGRQKKIGDCRRRLNRGS